MTQKTDAVTFEDMKAQLEAFRKKFGREPGPTDPVFFDPDLDVPVAMASQKITDQMIVHMSEAGIQPAMIWVYLETGLLPTQEHQNVMTGEDRRDTQDALRDFRESRPDIAPLIADAKARLAANNYYETIQ